MFDYEQIFAAAPAPMCLHGPDGKILSANPAFCHLLGYTEAELLQTNLWQLIPENAQLGTQETLKQILSDTVSRENEYLHKAGRTLWLIENRSLVQADKDQPLYFICQLQDITERKVLEQQLAEKMEQAETANFAKSTFLSHMSHELRTPLNAILGFAQIMEMQELPETLAPHVKEIMRSGWHLLDLVDDLLDLSRIETGDIDLHLEAVEVKGLVEECQSMISPLIRERKLSFVSSHEHCHHSIHADRRLLKQVIVNLLFNAIKYNQTDGEINVTCALHDTHLRINVRDTGQGIAAELLPRLFTPFDRLGKEGIEGSGSGIGLALAQRLTHKMGGEIGVDSVVGEGSTFWLEFERLETDQSNIQEKSHHYNRRDKTIPKVATRILCVEDNHANLRLIEGFFARQKHIELLTATDAATGLAMAKQHRPDIILMDIKLPDMNGFEALARLSDMPETKQIPVIAISAIAHQHDIAAGLSAGFYRYLTKPLNLQELEEAIHYALQDSGKQPRQ